MLKGVLKRTILKVLVGVGALVPTLGLPLIWTSNVRAQADFQADFQVDFQDNLPLLELPTAVSASALGDLQYRKIATDFDSVAAPAEATAAEPTVETAEMESGLGQAKEISNLREQPIYTQVEPNRAIETQTDPQRLTVVAPTTRPTTRP
jgi:hypothetical protein